MNIFRRMVWVLALAGVASSTPLLAQTEQWLDYHTSREAKGCRRIEVTTTPPPNVALPKLNAKGYFFRWVTPLDPAGRWICFDNTRKSGPYNRIYIDSNGNGRLDDKTAIEAGRTDEYTAYFDSVRLTFKGEDGPITYHLSFRFSKYDGDYMYVMVSSGGSYSGMVNVGGKKRRVELIDSNVNGTFNDPLPSDDCDRIIVDGGNGACLGRLLDVDGELFYTSVARDGAYVSFKKADDVVLGQVKVPETISEFEALGEMGQFLRKPAKGELSIPVGTYKIMRCKVFRKDDKGVEWQLWCDNFNQSPAFTVTAEKPAALDMGEPVHATLSTSDRGDNSTSIGLTVKGRFGESIQFYRGKERVTGPKLILSSLDGSYRATNSFEFG